LRVLVTGGSGFIGGALIEYILRYTNHEVLNVDKITYASKYELELDNEVKHRYHFEKLDICNSAALRTIFKEYKPTAIFHLAAETHVDNSINNPSIFIDSNIVGTFSLLEVFRSYYSQLSNDLKQTFKFIQISTDEVYGDLEPEEAKFNETSPFKPSSPYSASKAAADHLANAWSRTYKLPIIVTNCSNNYGPRQHDEKLIPTIIRKALGESEIPIYGDGQQIRDWLYVNDHAAALVKILTANGCSKNYVIGGNYELSNLMVAESICGILDEKFPRKVNKKYSELICFVEDRPGHDKRYAVNTSKLMSETNWRPITQFDEGIEKTIDWYVKMNYGYLVKKS
jgi:dTDP-glucose 4,6-dehydratase